MNAMRLRAQNTLGHVRSSFALCALLALGGASTVIAQIPGIELQTVTNEGTTVQVGQPATLSFVVTNRLGSPVTLADHVETPPGLRAVFDQNPYALQPGERSVRLVTVMVPRVLEAGSYTLGYYVQNDAGGVSRTVGQPIVIPAKVEVDVQRVEDARIVRAGDVHIARFRLENTGNTVVIVQVSASADRGLSPTPNVSSLTLRPGMRGDVTVEVPIPANWKGQQEVNVSLETTIIHQGSREVSSTSSGVEVLAERKAAFEYHRFPLSVATTAGGMESPRGGRETYFRTEVQGSGLIREGGSTRLGVLVRTPTESSQQPSLSQRERYLVEMRSPRLLLSAGDLSAPTASLAGGSVFGFGALGRLRFRYLELDAYRTENRLAFLGGTESGGAVLIRPVPAFAAGIRALNRKDDISPGTVVLVTSQISVGEYLQVGGELGLGRPDDESETRRGYALNLESSIKAVRLAGQYFHADDRFPSPRSNQSSGSVLLSAGAGSKVSASGNYFFNRFGGFAGFRGIRGPAFDSHTGSAEVGFDWRSRVRMVAGYDFRGRATRSGDQSETAWQHLGLVDFIAQFGTTYVSLRPTAGIAVLSNLQSRVVYGGSARVGSGLLANRLRLAASINHYEGPYGAVLTSSGSARVSSGSVSATVVPIASTSVSLRVSGSRGQNGEFRSSGLFGQAAVDHRLPWNHVISLGAVLSSYGGSTGGGQRQFEAAFTYTVPLQLPVHRSRRTGLVTGRLTEGATGRGLPDTAIFLGSAATLTGPDGRFNLPFVEPGEGEFRLEFPTSGREYVLREQVSTPIHGGRRQDADLVAVPAASISGVVRLRGEESGTEILGASGIMIRLAGTRAERVTVTDGDGSFSFRAIPDGTYSLSVLPESLGDLVIEDGQTDVDVLPGDSRSVGFVVRERRSFIQFQPLENAAAEAAPAPTTDVAEPTPTQVRKPTANAIQSRRLGTGPSFMTHQVRAGDTLRSLARMYFDGNSEMWALIYELNKGSIADPNVLHVGTTLRIPTR